MFRGLEAESSIGAWWPWMLHLVTDWTIPVTGGSLSRREGLHIIYLCGLLLFGLYFIYIIKFGELYIGKRAIWQ